LGLSSSEKTIEKILNEILKFSEYNLTSQNGLMMDDVKKIIINKQNIDGLLFYPILENIFKVNLIILCKDRHSLDKGGICPGNYKINYITDASRTLFDKSVIIFRTFGGEFDKLKHPHHELIIKEEGFEKNVDARRLVPETLSMFKQSTMQSNESLRGLSYRRHFHQIQDETNLGT
jgi:hypothetical protein